MKFLIKLVVVFAIILALFFAYLSTKPSSYDVKRTHVINAPISKVFKVVNDYNSWDKWGPWLAQDSTLVITVDKKFSGVDSGYSWTSKTDNGGHMSTLSLINNKSINQKIFFGGKGDADVYWSFEEVAKGTEVVWGIKGKLSLLEKAGFFVVGGAELMFGPMTAKGLLNLEEYIKTIKESDVTAIKTMD